MIELLIELLSQSNYVNFNIKLAHILGLNTAIYLSQIMDINEKAVRKKKVHDNFFTVDRKYIESRTTITVKEQKDIEVNLVKVGILKKSTDNENMIALDIPVLTSILASPDEDLIKDISFIAKPEKKRKTKADKIIENLKDAVITTNEELKQAYDEWIEAVVSKDGFMTVVAVRSAQVAIDTFSQRDLDVALKVLEIGAIHGYRDITWAINSYKKDYPKGVIHSNTNVSNNQSNMTPFTKVKLSDEIF